MDGLYTVEMCGCHQVSRERANGMAKVVVRYFNCLYRWTRVIRLNLPRANATQSLRLVSKNRLPKEWVILEGVQSIFLKEPGGGRCLWAISSV